MTTTTTENELSAYALLTARDNNCDRAAAVRMMADEVGEVSRETGVDEDAVREWIRAQA